MVALWEMNAMLRNRRALSFFFKYPSFYHLKSNNNNKIFFRMLCDEISAFPNSF